MRLPRATILALTADRASPTQPLAANRADGEYWLGHCEGFTVQSPQGQVGVVESVVYAADAPRPAYLAVTSGWLRLHTALVPCGEVVSVDGGCTGVKAVQDGRIAATSQQYPLKMASQGVDAIVDYAKNGTKVSGYTDTGVTLITAKPVAGVDSKDTTFGLANCWG